MFSSFQRLSYISIIATLAVGLVAFMGLAQDVQNEDTLVYLNIGQPQSLDPAWQFDTGSASVVDQIYGQLVFYEGGRTNSFVPQLASQVPTLENGGISEDGLTYEFPIRENVPFHSGDTLTPEDVEYTFQRLMVMDRDGGPSFLYNRPLLGRGSTRDDDGNIAVTPQQIDEAVTVDGQTVTFNLQEAFPPFLQIIETSSASILNKSFVVQQGGFPGFGTQAIAAGENGDLETQPAGTSDDVIASLGGDRLITAGPDGELQTEPAEDTDDQVVGDEAIMAFFNNPPNQQTTSIFQDTDGTGPFQLRNWDRANLEVTLSRFDDFQISEGMSNLLDQEGPAKLDNAIFREVPEVGPRITALQQGDADIIDLPRQRAPDVRGSEGVRVIDGLPSFDATSLFFNFEIQGFEDGSAQGVGSGELDGDGIPADFFQDEQVRKGFSHAFNGNAYIEDIFNGAAIQPATPISPALPFSEDRNAPDCEQCVEPPEFSPDKAEEAFKKAMGGSVENPGPVWQNGFQLTCFFNSGNTQRQTACQIMKAELRNINDKFQVEVQSVPWPVYLNQLTSGTMPFFALGWAPDFVDPDNFIRQWMHEEGTFSGPNQISVLDGSERWTELVDEGIATVDPEQRDDIYATLQQEFVNNYLAIMLSNPTEFRPTRTWLDGQFYNPTFAFAGGYLYTLDKEQGATPDCELLGFFDFTTSDNACQ